MSERFSNILSGKFQQLDPRQGVNVKVPDKAEFEAQRAEQARELASAASAAKTDDGLREMLTSLQSQIMELRTSVDAIGSRPVSAPQMPDMSDFVTSREQIKTLTSAIDRQNVEITNKQLVNAMGQISAMREDFFRLCTGMEKKIDTMSARDVLESFKAYEVDMENILTDGGVFIGHFPYDTLNTIHQRIVEVVPTDDPEKNGKIAERLSDGYKLGDRVLFKEKVTVWKYVESLAKQTDSQDQPAAEPVVQAEEPAATAEESVEKTEEPAAAAPAKPVRKTSSKKKKNQR